jgi:hypothetical protein
MGPSPIRSGRGAITHRLGGTTDLNADVRGGTTADRRSPHGEVKVTVDHGAGDVMDADAMVAGVFA